MKAKVLLVIVLGFFLFGQYLFLNISKPKQELEHWQMAMFAHKEKMTCINSGGLGFEIKVIYGDSENYQGRYFQHTNTLELIKTDIDTIAHESYHATQDILRTYDLYDDEEFGAYLQGFLTTCVLELVLS